MTKTSNTTSSGGARTVESRTSRKSPVSLQVRPCTAAHCAKKMVAEETSVHRR